MTDLKTILGLFFFTLGATMIAQQTFAQSGNALTGAWKSSGTDDAGNRYAITTIITDGYFSTTKYSMLNQKFYGTSGGQIEIQGNRMTKTYEYDTENKSRVGTSESTEFALDRKSLSLSADGSKWNKFDDQNMRAFSGAYLITGRKRDGQIRTRTPGARKTMKILAGPYFQWIAYNSETGDFFGTGGGTYTTVNGKYTEQIEFFSRDPSRIGAILEFDFEIEDGDWHHSGLSSKGNPIYEIWTLRSKL